MAKARLGTRFVTKKNKPEHINYIVGLRKIENRNWWAFLDKETLGLALKFIILTQRKKL
jgi:hypothetical protein